MHFTCVRMQYVDMNSYVPTLCSKMLCRLNIIVNIGL